jgi:hypothetical protein
VDGIPVSTTQHQALHLIPLAGFDRGKALVIFTGIRGEEVALLQAPAHRWLLADLAAWTRKLEAAQPEDRKVVQETPAHWREDTDLAGVRDRESLAKLSEGERKEWAKLWAGVAALLERAGRSR